MIIYFTLTALVNIALGYVLALYLGPVGRKHAKVPEHAAEHESHTPITSYEEPAMEEPTSTPYVAEAPVAAPVVTAEAVAATPAVEENLLAGINEFRNQLAQLNEAGEAEPTAAPVADPMLAAAK